MKPFWWEAVYCALLLLNFLARKRSGAFWRILRALGPDIFEVFCALKPRPAPCVVPDRIEEEGPTPIRPSQLPTLKSPVVAVKKDGGPDCN